MDNSKSSAGYTSIKPVILAQTDTTVGFLSQDKNRLLHVKNRSSKKPFLKNVFDLKTLKTLTRVPRNIKKEIRRAKKTTYIIKNQAFRVAKLKTSSIIFDNLKWCYSTSANKSGLGYDESFAKEMADIIVLNKYGLKEQNPSSLIKTNNKFKKRLR